NPSEMDTSSDLRRRLSYAEKQNLELINQRNRDMSHYEKEIMKLQLELERGEALRRGLENDLSIVQKEANMQMYSAEDELCNVK
ncbi:CC171 protein, partial [Origma solitaria]|nr:CC171 protein [Origma solitaria]